MPPASIHELIRSRRCIAFDAVGTLIHPVPSTADVYFQTAVRFGSRLTSAEIAGRFHQAFRESETTDITGQGRDGLSTSEPREYDRWRWIVARVIDDIADPQACFEDLFAHFARPASWKCFDEVLATLSSLQARGYRLLMASNFDRRLRSVCDGLPGLKLIDGCVISSEVGHRKPSPQFFSALLDAARCSAGELLMVGDDPDNDVVGARDAGIAALLINRKSTPMAGQLGSLAELVV